ncbi:MAG: hypothetical protein JWR80_9907 [Bradyrhizobium sp.]|nr:hypothetical protein [Bradyrhizobium sp.]
MDSPKTRRAYVVKCRRAGVRLREIAEELGISTTRVGQLYQEGLLDPEKEIPPGPATLDTPIDRLPVSARARKILARDGRPLSEMIACDKETLLWDFRTRGGSNHRAIAEISAMLEALRADAEARKPHVLI